jgi:hypothetical protein
MFQAPSLNRRTVHKCRDACFHFGGGFVGKCNGQNLGWIGKMGAQQMGKARGQDAGFSRARTGQNQNGALRCFHGFALRRIQLL